MADNPWKEISLQDYEDHMSLDSVHQLQAMNAMKEIGYSLNHRSIEMLPNGKTLVRMDFQCGEEYGKTGF